MMRPLFVSGTALALLAIHGGADAHAFLLKSEPVVGALVAAPKTVFLEFSEAVELEFSGVEVARAAGSALGGGKLHFAGNDRKVLVADLPQLPRGAYRVKWLVGSVDTYRTEGVFDLTKEFG
jgi:methionine-rich copper-binding protein CopC